MQFLSAKITGTRSNRCAAVSSEMIRASKVEYLHPLHQFLDHSTSLFLYASDRDLCESSRLYSLLQSFSLLVCWTKNGEQKKRAQWNPHKCFLSSSFCIVPQLAKHQEEAGFNIETNQNSSKSKKSGDQ